MALGDTTEIAPSRSSSSWRPRRWLKTASAYAALGVILLASLRFEEWFQRQRAEDPYQRGVPLSRQRKRAEAIAAYREAIGILPDE